MRTILGTFVVMISVAAAGATTLGPSPYLSFADSPFFGGSFPSFYVEDFEDGAFNTPNAAVSAGFVLAPGPQTDSVDADDGVIDGSGVAGRSWYATGTTVTISFAAVLGQYPTHVGVVWTDVGNTFTGPLGFADVEFEAFGPGGASLGTVLLASAGDGAVTGGTAEDRFFGVIDLGGVSAITLSVPNSADWELDHVQYGTVPEPTAALGLLLLAGCVRRR